MSLILLPFTMNIYFDFGLWFQFRGNVSYLWFLYVATGFDPLSIQHETTLQYLISSGEQFSVDSTQLVAFLSPDPSFRPGPAAQVIS